MLAEYHSIWLLFFMLTNLDQQVRSRTATSYCIPVLPSFELFAG